MYQIGDVLIKKEEIDEMLARMADEIIRDYKGRDIILVGVLKGAMVFLSDLMRRLKEPVIVDFIVVSSYGDDTETSGVVLLVKDVDINIEGKHVIIVEDLVDTGITLRFLRNLLESRKPASLRICAAFDKTERRKVDICVDYTGFPIPDKFVIGYGLDYAGRYRNLPEVRVLVDVP
jgi:hypoxanthine phosphoribosyltransferase